MTLPLSTIITFIIIIICIGVFITVLLFFDPEAKVEQDEAQVYKDD